jgi:hypothetical protein
MKVIKAAIGRTYNARSWEGEEGKTFSTRFVLEDFEVVANIGAELKHLVFVHETGSLVKKGAAGPSTISRKTIAYPEPNLFPADNYLEIVAYKEFEVDNDLFEAVKARQKPAVAQISKTLKTEEKRFYKALDFAAGFIGLNLDINLVSSFIVEQSYVYYPGSRKYNFSKVFNYKSFSSISFETAKSVMTELQQPGAKKLIKKWDVAAKPFTWLLRAWGTDEKVLKFVSFFTALEMLIPGLKPEENKAWLEARNQIISIIKNSEEANRKDLTALMTAIQAPNSIQDRFAQWAAEEARAGWEEDVKAFKRFSKMRNALLHRGEEDFDFELIINEKDVRTLEDIVKRYVFNSVFKS